MRDNLLDSRDCAVASLPAAYVINLDRSLDRLSHFRAINRGAGQVTRFRGVDGRTLDRNALVASGRISEDLDWGPGTIGCAMSHVGLWELAARQGCSITIFEDDVVLSHNFYGRAAEVMGSLPEDWDIILWGCRLHTSFAWIDLGDIRVKLHPYGGARYANADQFSAFQAQDAPRVGVKLLHAFGHHAYSISPKGAQAALDYFLPIRTRTIEFPDAGVRVVAKSKDVDLCGLYPSLQAFLCLPNLALPGGQDSVRDRTDAAAAASEDSQMS